MAVDPSIQHQRRFLVRDLSVLDRRVGDLIVQGYLFSMDGYVVRVRRTHYRTRDAGVQEGPAQVTVKGPRRFDEREVYGVDVSPDFAAELLKRTTHKVIKARYNILENRMRWFVDVFQSANEGLIIAELDGVLGPRSSLPKWCGKEVTNDRRYDNETLAFTPYGTWSRR